jgi:hypothetical protein
LLLLIANSVVAILQHFGVVGGFNVRGYQPNMSERVIGLDERLGSLVLYLTSLHVTFWQRKKRIQEIRHLWHSHINHHDDWLKDVYACADCCSDLHMKLSASLVTIIKRCLVVIPLLFAVYFFL